MKKQTPKKNQCSSECCSSFCDSISNLIKGAKTKYNKSDKETKKKIILGIASFGAVISGFLKLKKKNK